MIDRERPSDPIEALAIRLYQYAVTHFPFHSILIWTNDGLY
jgi:hypothetical protein